MEKARQKKSRNESGCERAGKRTITEKPKEESSQRTIEVTGRSRSGKTLEDRRRQGRELTANVNIDD